MSKSLPDAHLKLVPGTGAAGGAGGAELLLRRLEWTVLRRLDGAIHGNYRTLFRGFGLDLAELREYQYGDDVRHIDWNVTARTGQPYVRQFHEDREVTAWFLLDLSPSLDFGSSDVRKRGLSAEFVSVLARLLTRNGNRVGAMFYGDAVDTVIPARSGRAQVLHILHRMLTRPVREVARETDLDDFLQGAFRFIPRRSLVFLVSDFISRPGWAPALARLTRRHEVIAVRLYDPLEMELPDLGMVLMRDAETGGQLFVDTHESGFRKRFAAAAARRENAMRAAFAEAGVDVLELATDDALIDSVMRFADLRKRRSQLAGGGLPAHMAGGMKFLWPQMLWLLLLLPALVGLYLWLLRRKKQALLRHSGLALIREALAGGLQGRRHVPPLLFLVAIGLMIAAVTRPTAILTLPAQHETIVLAMDVSGSMRAVDVQPNRLAAAQAAAKAFVSDQPRDVRIGVVSFAATASVVQYPTQSREDVLNAIDRFQLQRGTAIGSGIIVSLATLFPDAGIDVSGLILGEGGSRRSFGLPRKDEKKEFKPVPAGSYNNGAIILLTDGQRTTGPDALAAAKMAAERGVRVFTVGIGTTKGETIGFEGWSMRVKLDEDTLKQVANITQGTYFYAGTANDLKKVYETLNTRFSLEKKETEISALFAAGAALFALLGAGLSLLWFNRIL